jgi:hypothetical protein
MFPVPGDDARNGQLTLAGWSTARQQCEAYVIRGGAQPVDGFPPRTLIEIPGFAAAPAPSRLVRIDPDHVDRDMLAVMEMQRRDSQRIGGHCELTTLTQHTVTQRILRRWAGDDRPHVPGQPARRG